MSHKNKMDSIIRSTGTVFHSLLYPNARQGFNGLEYVYSVISGIVDSLPGNTKNRESTRSWTARVRLFNTWAVVRDTHILCETHIYMYIVCDLSVGTVIYAYYT